MSTREDGSIIRLIDVVCHIAASQLEIAIIVIERADRKFANIEKKIDEDKTVKPAGLIGLQEKIPVLLHLVEFAKS
jgi:hypothetical protein